jgi:hypothetical protein
MSLTKFVGLLAGSTLTLTGVSYGAAEANNDTTAQINQLKAEIASLKAAQGDQWLTEQRAEQIRGVVQDVLADSSTRSSFQGAAATSGYDNGFFLSSADGNFKLKINALEQVRFTWGNGYGATGTGPNAGTNNQWGFENRRTQVFFSGNVVDPTWKYLVGMAYDSQTDPYVRNTNAFVTTTTGVTAGVGPTTTVGVTTNTGPQFQLYYAQITKDFGDGFSVTVGQQNAAFTLQSQLFNAGMTQMGEYSVFEYAFGLGQQVGISAKWEKDAFRAIGGFYNAAFIPFGAANVNSWDNNNNQSVALTGRAEFKMAGSWDQFSKESSFKGEEFGLVGGAGIFWQNARAQNDQPPYGFAPVGITVDANAKFGGFNAIAQVIWQNSYAFQDPNASTWGFNLQGGAFLTEDFELFAAWNYNNIGTESVDPTTLATTAVPGIASNFLQLGGNWYFAKNNMKMSVLATIPLNAAAGEQGSFSPAGQSFGMVNSAPGNNFGLVVQLQLMF